MSGPSKVMSVLAYYFLKPSILSTSPSVTVFLLTTTKLPRVVFTRFHLSLPLLLALVCGFWPYHGTPLLLKSVVLTTPPTPRDRFRALLSPLLCGLLQLETLLLWLCPSFLISLPCCFPHNLPVVSCAWPSSACAQVLSLPVLVYT